MLQKENCGLIVVDIQGTLARIVQQSDLFIDNTAKLIQCCKLLSIPIIWLEQNPKGLGSTVPEISNLLTESAVNEKSHFNALFEDSIKDAIKVDVVSDCISSRLQSNIALALVNMRESGASITSLEMCVFELVKKAKTDSFRKILSVIK